MLCIYFTAPLRGTAQATRRNVSRALNASAGRVTFSYFMLDQFRVLQNRFHIPENGYQQILDYRNFNRFVFTIIRVVDVRHNAKINHLMMVDANVLKRCYKRTPKKKKFLRVIPPGVCIDILCISLGRRNPSKPETWCPRNVTMDLLRSKATATGILRYSKAYFIRESVRRHMLIHISIHIVVMLTNNLMICILCVSQSGNFCQTKVVLNNCGYRRERS